MGSVTVHLNTGGVGGNFWTARWTDSDGKRRAKSIGRRDQMSKAEATRACRVIENGLALCSESITVQALSDRYLAGVPDTRHGDNVRRWVGRFVGFAGPNTPASSVRPVMADDWVESLACERATRAKAAGMVGAMFAYAERKEWVARNPFAAIAVRRVSKSLFVRPIDAAEFAAILNACPDPHWRCLFALCRWCGLRAGEAQRVRWVDLDMNKGTVRINTPDAENEELTITTKRRPRVVPLRQELRAELAACDRNDDGPCVAMGNNPARKAAAIVVRAGVLPYGEPLQSLRKMCVSEWQEKYPALAVAHWCGHSAQVALRHYYAPTDALVAEVTGMGTPRIVRATTAG